MENQQYVTRLAPSPTGALHLGNARTFLLTWLQARSKGGKILLRLEDLDHPRVKRETVAQVYADLEWLGLDWDGDILVQSERIGVYEREFERLREQGVLYPCFCSRADIQAAQSAPNLGEDMVYPNTCRPVRKTAGGFSVEPGRGCAWRFNIGSAGEHLYYDNFFGIQRTDLLRSSGDFVVARQDEDGEVKVSYQLACVIDDHATGITEVIRADDLINSTFRQLELYRALGYAAPEFLHLPLVVGTDGRRLAKRHGDSRISCLRQGGINPERVLGWLGWSCGFCREHAEVELDELLAVFSLEQLPTAKLVVTPEDLVYLGFS